MQTLHGYTVDETQWKSKGGGGQCNIAKKGGKDIKRQEGTTHSQRAAELRTGLPKNVRKLPF